MSKLVITTEFREALTGVFMDSFKQNLNTLSTCRISNIVSVGDIDTYFKFGNECYRIVEVNDYQNMSFLNLNLSKLDQVAIDLGKRAATAYNVLVSIAHQVYGGTAFVSDYSTMKLYVVVNKGPDITDPSGEITGWMAFKFRFVCGSTAQ